MTQVVAALIWDEDRFLACQRPAHKARGSLWEFVGGKVEPGETPQQALIRECREELDVTITVGDVFMELVHEYPDLTVKLTLFHAAIESGVPKLLEHQDIRWITTEQIDEFDFCPADEVILNALKQVSTGLQARLYALRDISYKKFHCALIPNIPESNVLGIRVPVLRAFAKNLTAQEKSSILSGLPHRFYEEKNLVALLINELKDYSSAVEALERFLPHVDNWATCDLLSPKAFVKRPEGLQAQILEWISSDREYTVRFGIGMLLKFYLDDAFRQEHLQWVGAVTSDAYYIRMMIAWYFATALAKQYDSTISWLEQGKLPVWVHNKTIQKAIESYRISEDKKHYLKSLKR